MKTYTITKNEVDKLSELINDLMQLSTTAETMKGAARLAIEAQTLLFNVETASPGNDSKCDKCGSAPLDALFWHDDKQIGFFCKKCFGEMGKEIGYVTLEKYHSSPSGKEPKKRPVK